MNTELGREDLKRGMINKGYIDTLSDEKVTKCSLEINKYNAFGVSRMKETYKNKMARELSVESINILNDDDHILRDIILKIKNTLI